MNNCKRLQNKFLSEIVSKVINSIFIVSMISIAGCGGSNDSKSPSPSTSPANSAPISSAGSDQNVEFDSIIMFDGSGSNDPDGDTMSYQWSVDSQPSNSTATFNNSQMVKVELSVDTLGTYVINLTVSDGTLSAQDSLTLTITEVTGPPTTTNGNHRVSKIEHDYDLNGLIDARTILTYSDDSKTVTSQYEYLGDGTPDLYIHGVEGIMASNEVTFSDSGQQLTFSMINYGSDGGMLSILYSYSYLNDGNLEQLVVDLSTDIFANIATSNVVYSNGRITSLTDPDGLQPSIFYRYNSDGTLASREMVEGETVTQKTDFLWRSDGQLESATTQNLSLNPVKSESLTVFYNGNGKVERFVQSDEQYPTSAASNLTATYTWNGDKITEIAYDPFSKGSIEAIETITWEEGTCYNQYLPNFGLSLPHFDASQSSVFIPGIFISNPLCIK